MGRPAQLRDPRPIQTLFGQTRFAWAWFAVRLFLGWQWLMTGRQLMGDPGWMPGGAELRDFWQRTLHPAGPDSTASPGTWHDLIEFMLRHGWYTWIGPVVAIGAVVAGICLILGLLVGVAAFGGAMVLLQLPPDLSGGANPLALGLAILLMFAWKTAGWIGLDRWVLPLLGAPWRGSTLLGRADQSPTGTPEPDRTPAKRRAG